MPPTKPELPGKWDDTSAPDDIGDYLDQVPLEAESFVVANTLLRRDPVKLIADQRFNRAEFERWLERYREAARI